MANDYIKFSRPEFEVVGGKSDMQDSRLIRSLMFEQAISHQ